MRIVYGEWMPDAPGLDVALTEALNVMPYGDHYRPLLGPSATSNALASTPYAAIATSNIGGIAETYVATLSNIYRLDSGTTWTDVTGLAITTEDPMRWSFAQYDKYVLAATYNNLLRYKEINVSANFVAITDAPRARVLGIVRDFVMAGDINDPTDGNKPHRVRWNAIDDPLSWPLPGTASAIANQADEQDLKAEHGAVRAIFGSDAGLIFQERAITRATYVGAPLVFRFDLMDGSRGLFAPKGAAQLGRLVYFIAQDGFFVTDGSGESTPIGNGKVDRWFYENLVPARQNYIQTVIYPSQKCIAWFFSKDSGTYNDHVLLYNYTTQRWAHGQISCYLALTGRTAGYTLDQLDPFGTLDTLTASLDSETWQGGTGFPAIIDENFKLASLDGTALEARLETGAFGLDGRRMYVDGIRPLIEGGTAQITLGTQAQLDDAVSWGTERSITASTGKADFRSSAFFHRVRARVAGGFTKTVGIDALVQADDGAR